MELLQVLSAFGVGNWLRWVVTIIALSMALYLSWRYSGEKGLQRTIDIQKDQLKILDEQNKTFKEKIEVYKEKGHECDLAITELKKQIDLLRVKTDLTSLYEVIANATKTSSEKYDAKFETIHAKLDTLMSKILYEDKESKKRRSSVD